MPSNRNSETKSNASSNPSSGRDDAVGYGKPPRSGQFQKGQSGNPKGRPRKDTSHRGLLKQIISEKQRLSGQPKGAKVWYSVLELVIMAIKQKAAAGHRMAAKLYTRIADRYSENAQVSRDLGYLVVPERLTEEEWAALYAPKDTPPEPDEIEADTYPVLSGPAAGSEK